MLTFFRVCHESVCFVVECLNNFVDYQRGQRPIDNRYCNFAHCETQNTALSRFVDKYRTTYFRDTP